MARKRTTSKFRNYVDIYGNYHTGYTHKTKSGKHQLNMAWELEEILNEYANDLIHEKEIALDQAADFMMEKLKQNSPSSPESTGKFKESWVRTDQYSNVRYIGNTRVAGKNKIYGGDIPLSNILEFKEKGRPFIRRTFDENRSEIIRIIREHLDNASKK